MSKRDNQSILENWRSFYSERCVSEDKIEEYINYASQILENKGCIIMDAAHLIQLTGIDKKALYSMVYGEKNFITLLK